VLGPRAKQGEPRFWQIALRVQGPAWRAERRLHRLLRSAGIRGWQANYPVWVDGELIAVVDVALIASRIAIEVDGTRRLAA